MNFNMIILEIMALLTCTIVVNIDTDVVQGKEKTQKPNNGEDNPYNLLLSWVPVITALFGAAAGGFFTHWLVWPAVCST